MSSGQSLCQETCLFIYLLLAVLCLHCCAHSLVELSGLLTLWFLFLWSMGSKAWVQWLWHTGLLTPQHVESSQTRRRIHDSWIGRWILNHWTTREVQKLAFLTRTTGGLGTGPSVEHTNILTESVKSWKSSQQAWVMVRLALNVSL